MKRRLWSEEEDQRLLELVTPHPCWIRISYAMSRPFTTYYRSPKACRERFINNLNPQLKQQNWTQMEQSMLFQLSKKHGNKWSLIAEQMEGRSEGVVKNYFYSQVRKVIRRLMRGLYMQRTSQETKKIKSCVLSGIYSDTQMCLMDIPEQLKQEFRDMIDKYQNYSVADIQANLDKEQIETIKLQLSNIMKFNYEYSVTKLTLKYQKELGTDPIFSKLIKKQDVFKLV